MITSTEFEPVERLLRDERRYQQLVRDNWLELWPTRLELFKVCQTLVGDFAPTAPSAVDAVSPPHTTHQPGRVRPPESLMAGGRLAGRKPGLPELSGDMVSLLILLRPLLHHEEAGTFIRMSADGLSALIAHRIPVRWKQPIPLLLPLNEVQARIPEWVMQTLHFPEKGYSRRGRTEAEAYDRLIKGLNLSVQRKGLSDGPLASSLPHAGIKARQLSGSRPGAQVKLGLWLAEPDTGGIRLTDLHCRFDNPGRNALEALEQEIGYRLQSSLFMWSARRTSCILPLSFLEHARDKAQASWASSVIDRLMASRQTARPWPAIIVLRRLEADTSGRPIGDDAALKKELLHVIECRQRRAEWRLPRKGQKRSAMRFDKLRGFLDQKPRRLDSHDWRLAGW